MFYMRFDKHELKKYSHKELTQYCEQYFHETFPDAASLSKYFSILNRFLTANGKVLTDNEITSISEQFYQLIYDSNFSRVDYSVFNSCSFPAEFDEPVILQHHNKYFNKLVDKVGKQSFQMYLKDYKKYNKS